MYLFLSHLAVAAFLSLPVSGHALDFPARARLEKEAARRRLALSRDPASWTGVQTYCVVSSTTTAGTGFLVEWKGKTLGVTARHPFPDGDTPREFEDLATFYRDFFHISASNPADAKTSKMLSILLSQNDFNSTEPIRIRLGRRVVTDVDMQALTIEGPYPRKSVLQYRGQVLLREGDEIIILTDRGPKFGKVQLLNPSRPVLPGEPLNARVIAEMSKPFIAAACSGAPVILRKTGTVVGILLNADNPGHARHVLFDMLRLDTADSKDREYSPLRTLFGLPLRDPEKAREVIQNKRLFPASLLAVHLGTDFQSLASSRPYLYASATPSRVTERLGRQYYFNRFICGVVPKEGTGSSPKVNELLFATSFEFFQHERYLQDDASVLDFLLDALGQPDKITYEEERSFSAAERSMSLSLKWKSAAGDLSLFLKPNFDKEKVKFVRLVLHVTEHNSISLGGKPVSLMDREDFDVRSPDGIRKMYSLWKARSLQYLSRPDTSASDLLGPWETVRSKSSLRLNIRDDGTFTYSHPGVSGNTGTVSGRGKWSMTDDKVVFNFGNAAGVQLPGGLLHGRLVFTDGFLAIIQFNYEFLHLQREPDYFEPAPEPVDSYDGFDD